MKEHTFENVLIIRTDRIGDVVLTLPLVSAIRAAFPRAMISMLLHSYTQELVEGYEGLDRILAYDDSEKRKDFLPMLGELRSRRFDLVIVSHPRFRIAVLMFLARIPLRVGSAYRWYSLLFNKRVFEHRKTAEKHEAEYNLSLLQAIGRKPSGIPPVNLVIPESAKRAAMEVLKSIGVSPGEKVVVIHPGSGGSAREWSPRNFGELAGSLRREGYRVVVTGSASEEELANSVVRYSGGSAVSVAGRFSLKQLAAFLSLARLVVSNSTGPLHIAAAVGTPVIAFYPPIRECSPRRWGPLTDSKVIFTADNTICPRCKGGACQGNDCMEQIQVADVLRAACKFLAPEEPSNRV